VSVAPVAITLRRLKITRFRDVRPGTELHLSPGWNVLLGRNATGKTTLLHLISMALRGDFDAIKDDPFELEYELGNDDVNLRVHLKNEVLPLSHVANDPRFVLDRPMPVARRVTFSALYSTGTDSLLIQPAPAPMTPGVPTLAFDGLVGEQLLFVSSALLHARRVSPESLSPFWELWFGGQLWKAFRFDEALELFRYVRGFVGDAAGIPESNSPTARLSSGENAPWMSFAPSKATWQQDAPQGKLSAVHGTFTACENLSWCAERCSGTGFRATYPVTENTREGEISLATLGPPTFLLDRLDGGSTSIKHLSFGQKRLFAFAWYLDSNPGPVVADELVNGMHYEWIEDCVRAMEGRQKFVTAQNPLLLDHVGFDSSEDVTRSFVLCRAEPRPDNRREVAWTHPSETQAREFFRAYENGVLRVHEILRTEGLW